MVTDALQRKSWRGWLEPFCRHRGEPPVAAALTSEPLLQPLHLVARPESVNQREHVYNPRLPTRAATDDQLGHRPDQVTQLQRIKWDHSFPLAGHSETVAAREHKENVGSRRSVKLV